MRFHQKTPYILQLKIAKVIMNYLDLYFAPSGSTLKTSYRKDGEIVGIGHIGQQGLEVEKAHYHAFNFVHFSCTEDSPAQCSQRRPYGHTGILGKNCSNRHQRFLGGKCKRLHCWVKIRSWFFVFIDKAFKKATIYAKSLNQFCRDCSSCSGFAIGCLLYFSTLFILTVSCAVIYMYMRAFLFKLHCQNLASGMALVWS